MNIEEVKKMDWSSRKYRSAWYLTAMFTFFTMIPGIVSFIASMVTGKVINFELVPVGYYVTLVGLIWGVYFGANVLEKLPSLKQKNTIQIENVDETGGQPKNSIGNEP